MVYMRTNTPSRFGSQGASIASIRPRRRREGGSPSSGGRDPQPVISKDRLFGELKKALAERILNAEPDDHLEAEAAEGRIARGAAISRRLAEQPLAG